MSSNVTQARKYDAHRDALEQLKDLDEMSGYSQPEIAAAIAEIERLRAAVAKTADSYPHAKDWPT